MAHYNNIYAHGFPRQQRVAQTGADSTAESGAIVLASRLAGAATPALGWDGEVANKIAQSAAANNTSIQAAYYTDICGIPLRNNGNAALNADGTENLSVAQQVGSGLPGGNATTPDCPSLTVGPVAGVLVIGQKNVPLYCDGMFPRAAWAAMIWLILACRSRCAAAACDIALA
jgi:hypothetical protein